MLVTVKEKRLVLGVTIYKRGDIFDCNDPEAVLLTAAKAVEKSKDGDRPTRESPQPGKTGITNRGVPVAPKEEEKRPVLFSGSKKKKKPPQEPIETTPYSEPAAAE